MRNPNLFIVGAPKCGTTSLHYYLNQHQDIFLCDPKEPNYFNTDLKRKNRITSKEYFNLFKNQTEKYIGEATPLYLMSKNASHNIKEISPQAKIIISIRRPADLIYSAFLQNRFNIIEEEVDLLKAIELEEYRKQNVKSTKTGEPVERLIYSNFVLFTSQIKRYINCFGQENVHVLIFDDLKKNTEKEVLKIFKFLNVDTKINIDLNRQNQAKSIKSEKIADMLYSPSPLISKLFGIVPTRFKHSIYTTLKKLNTDNSKPPKMDSRVDKFITMLYKTEIDNLEK